MTLHKKSFAIIAVLLLPLCAASAPQSQPIRDGYSKATTVELIARGPDGITIPITTAKIYLDEWGGGQLVTLPVNRESATLRLDQDSLCKSWSQLCTTRMYGPSRLILKADGFAPVTGLVRWPQQTTTAGILFSGGRNTTVPEGATQRIEVTFRRSVLQSVRIIDESGKPAAGIEVEAAILFAASNHSGGVEGERVASGKTNPEGRMTIPDADGELALDLSRGHFALLDSDPVSAWRKIVIPSASAAPINLTLHLFQKQILNWTVARANGSISALVLTSCLNRCTGACCGNLATVNAQGEVRVDDFYPEETESLSIVDSSGATLWKATEEQIRNPSSIKTITIPAAAPR